jgi:hypothetical protein
VKIAGSAAGCVFPRLIGALVVMALTMSVDLPEFVRIVRSSDHELRNRFRLPVQCDPVVSAVREPRHKVRVWITCLAESRRVPAERR